MRIPSTDVFCLFPIIQQVVGVATVLSNLIKVIHDIARGILTKTWKGQPELYDERDQLLNDVEKLKEFDQKLFSLPGYQFERHLGFICIGIIRAIPVVGTVYSLGVLTKYLSARLELDDPRQPKPI